MEKSIKSSAITYGVYLSCVLALFTVLGYVIKIEILVNFWLTMLILPLIIIVFGIISTAKAKGLLSGFINFKQAFSSYFITVAIGIMISTLVTIILFNFIDPEAAEQLKELMIEKVVVMMEKFGAPEEATTEAITQIENQDTFGLGTQFKSLAQSLIFFAIIGLIVALSFKKTDPNAA